jgi:hypothetical protein
MREMAGILGDSATVAAKSRRPGSLFSLLYLNPLAGLDPTTQAIEETRLLAQRMFYYAQRAPMLLSWQVELTTTQLASQPEARQVLADLTDVGASLKVFANTASGLTNLVNAQREAAINQIFDRLARERTNLVADLAAEQTKLRALLDESRRTLDAGATMATSVNAAIQSLDSFVRYVSPPATNPIPSAQATNGQPFNVLDYGTAATQVGAMATELTALLQAANQSEAQVSRLGRQTTEDLRGVVNHAFRLGLVLLVASAALGWFLLISWRRRSPSPPPK